MAKQKETFNVFYALVLVVGMVFAITAIGYGIMAIRAVRLGPAEPGSQGYGLMHLLDQHGAAIMGAELALLAVATFGAMAWDRFWELRREATAARAGNEQPSRESVS